MRGRISKSFVPSPPVPLSPEDWSEGGQVFVHERWRKNKRRMHAFFENCYLRTAHAVPSVPRAVFPPKSKAVFLLTSMAESRAGVLLAKSTAALYLPKYKSKSEAESKLVRRLLSPTDFVRPIAGIAKLLKFSLSPPASGLKPHLAKQLADRQ